MWIKTLFVLYYLMASTSGLILVKHVTNGHKIELTFKYLFDYRLVLGGGLYITSFIAWFFILTRSELSFIYPIVVGLGYVAIIILSYFVLHEQIDFYRLIGIVIILTGVLIIVLKGKGA